MDDILKKAEELKTKVEADAEKRAVLSGKLEASMETLKEMGYDSVEDAKEALKKQEKEIAEQKRIIIEELQELKKLCEEGASNESDTGSAQDS